MLATTVYIYTKVSLSFPFSTTGEFSSPPPTTVDHSSDSTDQPILEAEPSPILAALIDDDLFGTSRVFPDESSDQLRQELTDHVLQRVDLTNYIDMRLIYARLDGLESPARVRRENYYVSSSSTEQTSDESDYPTTSDTATTSGPTASSTERTSPRDTLSTEGPIDFELNFALHSNFFSTIYFSCTRGGGPVLLSEGFSFESVSGARGVKESHA